MNEGSAKQQIVEGIKTNTNILVTVSDSPSVDELSAALGLTMILNKMDKRATAIFSGTIPPAITFLDPEKTFEGTVDSLRDFIIALDKEKADHLRYKVDGDVVKIFITPYRTTLTDKDLEFSQGDYNVEMVVALGVKDQDHLDKALAAHGRILHDATVASVSVGATPSSMGSIDWRDAAASSLCEMLVSLSEALKDDTPLLDEQIASAFLTGIVSATDRFSNDHTSSRVMTMAAQLMAAGANQQLIAAKLQEAHDIGPTAPDKSKSAGDENNSSDQKEEKSKKKKRDDSSLKIDRASKSESKKQQEPKNDQKPAEKEPEIKVPDESAAITAAVEQAEPAKDVEKELAEQLADVAPSIPAPAATPADLEKELNEALETDVSTPVAEPEIAAVPAPAPAPETPDVPPIAAPVSDGMPGFEPLDVPAPEPVELPEPASTVSPSISGRSGSAYIEPAAPASFDQSVGNIEVDEGEAEPASVDPFSAPLPPLPDDLREPTTIAVPEPQQPEVQPPENVVADTPPPTLEEIEESNSAAAMPPLPPLTMPPLPPLPDFSSDTNLPPLPPPPPPPVFGQLGGTQEPMQPGAVSTDKLGDIFGDAPKNEVPSAPQTPPKPGQFQIPGQ